MSTRSIENLSRHSILADAAYMDWNKPVSAQDMHEARNMDMGQAQEFLDRYDIIGSTKSDLKSGFYASLVQDKNTNELHVITRGTEPPSMKHGIKPFIKDGIQDLKLALGSGVADEQYEDLKKFISEMKSEGLINGPITLSGHSLGGHLNTKFALDNEKQELVEVAHTYNYNAPGLGGVKHQLKEFLGLEEANIPNHKMTNINTIVGPEATAGLGLTHGTNISIHTDSIGGMDSHSQEHIVNSMPLYETFSQLGIKDIQQINNIIEAASNKGDDPINTVKQQIAGVFGIDPNLTKPDKSVEFKYAIEERASELGDVKITPLVSDAGLSPADTPSHIEAAFNDSGEKGQSYRYALENKLSFVIEGTGLYDKHNTNGELDLYDPCTKNGKIHPENLTEKIDAFEKQLWLNQRNIDADIGKNTSVNRLTTMQSWEASPEITGSNNNNLECKSTPNDNDLETMNSKKPMTLENFTLGSERIEIKTEAMEINKAAELDEDDMRLSP